MLRTWETANTIVATHDWDEPDAQVISEEKTEMELNTIEMEELPSPAIPGENGEDADEDHAEKRATEASEKNDLDRGGMEIEVERDTEDVQQDGSDDARVSTSTP